MRAILLVFVPVVAFGQTALDRARTACEKDLSACVERDRLEAAASMAKMAPAPSEAAPSVDAEAAAQKAKEDALKAKCGKDYGRVRVGMSFERVAQCAGEFSMIAQDERGTVYEAAGGVVRVEHGKVTRWAAK